MSKLVMVECVSMFRTRYVVETPDGHTEYALDDVTCGGPEEFDQEHLGETIVSHRVVTEEEVLSEYDKGNLAYLSGWSKEKKLANVYRYKDPENE
jgi:hypothetical protein